MELPSTSSEPGWDISRQTACISLTLLVLAFAILMAVKMDAGAGGADSSGYLNQARLLSKGKVFTPMRTIEDLKTSENPDVTGYLYVPLGFKPFGADTMAPTYPIGIPLLVAGIAGLVGWSAAPGITIALHGMAGLLVTYALARKFGASRGWALIGVSLAGTCPLYVLYSLQLMTDMPAYTWCAASILAAWSSRNCAIFAAVAGVCLSIAVLVRPTNALVLLPAALALGLSWRRWALFGLAGLPGAAVWAWYNNIAYGHPLASGYGNIVDLLDWKYIGPTFQNYLRWLPALLTPLLLLLLALPRLFAAKPLVTSILTLWVAVFVTFYAFYYCTHESWWYLRFLLPCFPALILLITLSGFAFANKLAVSIFNVRSRRSLIASCVVMTLLLSSNIYWIGKQNVLRMQDDHLHYAKSSAWARENLPANAVILAMQTSGALFYYTDFTIVRWDSASPADLQKVASLAAAAGRPLYAATFPFETEEPGSLPYKLSGWQKLTRIGQTTIWKHISPSTP